MESICILQENKESRVIAPSVASCVENKQTSFSSPHYYHNQTLPHLPFRYNTSRKEVVVWAINRMEADMIFQDLLADGGKF